LTPAAPCAVEVALAADTPNTEPPWSLGVRLIFVRGADAADAGSESPMNRRLARDVRRTDDARRVTLFAPEAGVYRVEPVLIRDDPERGAEFRPLVAAGREIAVSEGALREAVTLAPRASDLSSALGR
jgi:hypothetical protein